MSYAQTIYNQFRAAGMTEAGALGFLGNLQQESGCEPLRLQNDYDIYRRASKDYVARANNGNMSIDEFAKPVGFGLAQWTLPQRKRNLWNFWKKYGGSLDNVTMQVQFILHELNNEAEYRPLWTLLRSTNDLYQATNEVCCTYERPKYNNVGARLQSAKDIKAQLDLGAFENSQVVVPDSQPEQPQPAPGWETIPATEYWPPRMICKGMEGPDVAVLQAVLYARGYMIAQIDGKFGSYLEDVVKTFQRSFSLDVDGIVGPKTWGKLLERG